MVGVVSYYRVSAEADLCRKYGIAWPWWNNSLVKRKECHSTFRSLNILMTYVSISFSTENTLRCARVPLKTSHGWLIVPEWILSWQYQAIIWTYTYSSSSRLQRTIIFVKGNGFANVVFKALLIILSMPHCGNQRENRILETLVYFILFMRIKS